jgi:hypothetical protein
MNALIIFYMIFSSPILLGIIGGAILLAVIIVAVSKSNKKREQAAELARFTEEFERRKDERANTLVSQFGPELASRMLHGEIWQGMTAEQLTASAGAPEAVDSVVTKTVSKEIWKYGQTTATRFDTRITLENGVVVGWVKH